MQPSPALDKIVAQVPRNLSGVERHRLIADLVNQLPAQESDAMREVIHGFITAMDGKNASDVDMGG